MEMVYFSSVSSGQSLAHYEAVVLVIVFFFLHVHSHQSLVRNSQGSLKN